LFRPGPPVSELVRLNRCALNIQGHINPDRACAACCCQVNGFLHYRTNRIRRLHCYCKFGYSLNHLDDVHFLRPFLPNGCPLHHISTLNLTRDYQHGNRLYPCSSYRRNSVGCPRPSCNHSNTNILIDTCVGLS